MAEIIKSDGQRINITPENGKRFQLEELQEIVGGYIENLQLPDGRYMVVNEEGRLYGLPVNMAATHIYGYTVIVGDVVICEKREL